MPPLPPLIDEAELFRLFRDDLPVGSQFHMEVTSPFTPQLMPEGGYVFQIGDKVFTIYRK